MEADLEKILYAELFGGGGGAALEEGPVSLSLEATYSSLPSYARSAAWHPSGGWVAVTSNTAPKVSILRFNRTLKTFTSVATYAAGTYADMFWNSAGTRLLMADTSTLRVLEFNQATEALSLRGSYAPGNTIWAACWHPDEDRVLISWADGAGDGIRVLNYNDSTGAFTVGLSRFVTSYKFNWLSFNADGDRLLGVQSSGSVSSATIMYSFVRATNAFATVATASPACFSPSQGVWSPDYSHIAISSTQSTYGPRLWIHSFDKVAGTLTLVARLLGPSQGTLDAVFGFTSPCWSADGSRIFMGATGSGLVGRGIYMAALYKGTWRVLGYTPTASSGPSQGMLSLDPLEGRFLIAGDTIDHVHCYELVTGKTLVEIDRRVYAYAGEVE